MTEKAEPTISIDNDKVQVADWRMAPDTQIGDHVHPSDYLGVPLSLGNLVIATAEGELTFPLDIGATYFGSAGEAHDVLNRGTAEVRFLEIHIKS